jgi:cyclomaltodextrinase / maltogenic alpha-amylase / neopullulanase
MTRPGPEALAGLMLIACLGAGACTSGERSNTSSSSTPAEAVRFNTRGGDAFAWTTTIAGTTQCGDVTVEVNGEPAAKRVTMTGSRFESDVPILSGKNRVVARCESTDDTSEPLVINGRLRKKPIARIEVLVNKDTVTLEGNHSGATQPSGAPITRYEWSTDQRHPARLLTSRGRVFRRSTGPRLRLKAPVEDGEYYVSLEVSDAQGHSDESISYFVVENGAAREVDLMHEHPTWMNKAVVYAPIPQLWGNGGPKSVQRRLPYLRKLGADVLWLWPPSSLRAFGEEYAITDYFKVDPSWGPEPALKNMVDEAHRLGMHVIIDFVPNHMSTESPFFKDGKKYGDDSPYYEFFDRNPRGKPTHYFDWMHLPNLNFDNPEVRTMITEATAHWVRDIGIDGFRMDVAWGVKRRAPDFWLPWRKEMKRINPDLFLLAEATAIDPYYFSHGFDVAYDWTRNLGDWAWGSAFEFPQESGTLLETAITNSGKGYAANAIVLRFLNNNDTGVRFVAQYGPEVTKMAAVLQFTVPGIPALFAGDEIGASYQPYSNLTPMSWRDRFKLRPLYKRLIDLKHDMAALNSSRIQVLTTTAGSVLAYVRPAVDGSKAVLVALNFGGKQRVRIESSPAMTELLARSGGAMLDLLTNDRLSLSGGPKSVSVSMDKLSTLVLTPETG